jgi:hypothetical protein
MPPYSPSPQRGYTPNPQRDAMATTMALQGINNPAPGYLQPPSITGVSGVPPFGGIPGGAQPQAALGPAQPPMGPMGQIGGPMTPGLNLPGVSQPGQLPQGMAPQNVLGGMPQQRPTMPMPGGAVPGRPY